MKCGLRLIGFLTSLFIILSFTVSYAEPIAIKAGFPSAIGTVAANTPGMAAYIEDLDNDGVKELISVNANSVTAKKPDGSTKWVYKLNLTGALNGFTSLIFRLVA
jgi:hypothetical protein